MAVKTIAELKAKFTDQYVEADAGVPDLARFKGKAGRVVTVNENGKALIDFGDGPWYDIELANLTVVEKPEAPAGEEKKH